MDHGHFQYNCVSLGLAMLVAGVLIVASKAGGEAEACESKEKAA